MKKFAKYYQKLVEMQKSTILLQGYLLEFRNKYLSLHR